MFWRRSLGLDLVLGRSLSPRCLHVQFSWRIFCSRCMNKHRFVLFIAVFCPLSWFMLVNCSWPKRWLISWNAQNTTISPSTQTIWGRRRLNHQNFIGVIATTESVRIPLKKRWCTSWRWNLSPWQFSILLFFVHFIPPKWLLKWDFLLLFKISIPKAFNRNDYNPKVLITLLSSFPVYFSKNISKVNLQFSESDSNFV
jgi:hypothetical protein